jgi:hypothetical protein
MANPHFQRWPIDDQDRRKVVDVLLECVANGSPMHRIRAAKTLLEIDLRNRINEISIPLEELQAIIEERKTGDQTKSQG